MINKNVYGFYIFKGNFKIDWKKIYEVYLENKCYNVFFFVVFRK